MKLLMADSHGRAFYVLKPWGFRWTDPTEAQRAQALRHARLYSLDRMVALDLILQPPMAPGIVVVAADAPQQLGGSPQGFWKLLQRRMRVKHASRTADRRMPVDLAMESLMTLVNAKPVQWFARCCGRLLSECVQRPGGVHVVVDALVGSDESASAADYARAVRTITAAPQGADRAAYMAAVLSQLVPLVASQEEHHVRVCVQLLAAAWDDALVPRCFVEPLLEPLRAYASGAACMSPAALAALSMDPALSEKLVNRCVVGLARLLRSGSDLRDRLVPLVRPVVPALVDLYVFSARGVWALKEPLRDVALAALRHCGAVEALLAALCDAPGRCFAFASGPGGGVALCPAASAPAPAEPSQRAQRLHELLAGLADDQTSSALFVELLRRAASSQGREQPGGPCAAALLAEMCESLSPGAFGDLAALCGLLREVLQSADAGAVAVALSILDAVLSGRVDVAPEQAFAVHALLPQLELLRKCGPSDDIRAAADRLVAVVAAPDPRWTRRAPAVEEERGAAAEAMAVDGPMPPALQAILAQLADPLAAVRGHALVRLRRHVLDRDPAVCARIPEVLDLLVQQLASPDEVVYLAAVNGLSGVSDVCPREALERLSRAYVDGALALGPRLCVGEALVQAVLVQGELLPSRAACVSDAVFAALRDAQGPVRASALSLLGTMCSAQGVAAHAIAVEAVCAARELLASDPEPLVRRAAVVCVAEFCGALAESAGAVLSVKVLRETRAALAAAAHYDQDVLVRDHCSAAVETLDAVHSATLGLVQLME
eukprot:m51a1_g4853 hypothetical protein (778) ;mRNA; r:279666-289406